jgi:hypothetical protein
MDLDIKDRMVKFYTDSNKQLNGMKFKKWINANLDIKLYLEKELDLHKNLNKISNIFICIVNDIDLNSFICKICGKELKIRAISQPIKYCSTKCAMNDTELQNRKLETIKKDPEFWKKRAEKSKATCLERYGTKTPAESEIIKEKMKETFSKDPEFWKKRNEKSKATCLERYGVENASSTKLVREKVKETNIKKYGVENINKLPETLTKIKNTCLEKYRS